MMHQKTLIGLIGLMPMWVHADSTLAADALRQLIDRQEAVSTSTSNSKKQADVVQNTERRTETLKPTKKSGSESLLWISTAKHSSRGTRTSFSLAPRWSFPTEMTCERVSQPPTHKLLPCSTRLRKKPKTKMGQTPRAQGSVTSGFGSLNGVLR
jgi:hypothetical protein